MTEVAGQNPVEVRAFAGRSLLGLVTVAAVGGGFGVVGVLVRLPSGPLLRLDHGVATGLNQLVSPHPGWVRVLTSVSALGGRPVLIWLTVLAVLLLLIRRRRRLALYLLVAGAGALLLDPSLKTLIGRVRPVV